MSDSVAGIDIGGTKIAVAIADENGTVGRIERFLTPHGRGPYAILGQAIDLVLSLSAEQGGRLTSVGIGCAGPLDRHRGLVLSPPNLPDWDEFPIVQIVEDRLGVPVVFDNDANAAALGELRYGAGRGLRDMVYVTMSTGIGGGIIVDGEIVHGIYDTGGEVGHMIVQPDGPLCGCGGRGCVEAIASGTGIAKRARERVQAGSDSAMVEMAGGVDEITAETVARATREGDAVAMDVWEETVRYFAIAINNIMVSLAPEAVVIGGGVAAAGDLLFEPLREKVLASVCVMPSELVRIVPAELGGDSGAYGAVILGLRDRSR